MRPAGESGGPPTVTLVGFAYDASSSFERGAALAPPEIRAALRHEGSNPWTEQGCDLAAPGVLDDAGDITPPEGASGREAIERTIAGLLDEGRTPLAFGGDHSITYPIVRAFRARYPALSLLHFDAHADLYHDFAGDPYSHACPMARIMEERLVDRLVQIGIRTLTDHQRDQIERFGVETFEMRQWDGPFPIRFETPVYITLDLDVLDPAFVAGISHPEPGGLSVREVLGQLARVEGRVVGADLVELNPRHDATARSGLVCAKLVKALVDLMRR